MTLRRSCEARDNKRCDRFADARHETTRSAVGWSACEPGAAAAAKRQRRDTSPVIYCHDDCARHVTTGDGDAEHQESPARLSRPSRQRSKTTPGAAISRPRAAKLCCAFIRPATSTPSRASRLAAACRRCCGRASLARAASTRPLARRRSARARGRRRRAAGAALAAVRDRRPARAPSCSCGRRAPRDARGLRCKCGRLRLLRAGERCGRRGGGADVGGDAGRRGTLTFIMVMAPRTLRWSWARNGSCMRRSTCVSAYPGNAAGLFPGRGSGTPRSAICNVPVTPNWIEPGARERFVAAVKEILPVSSRRSSEPHLIISAGFDALEGDAGQLNPWTPDDPDLPPNLCRPRSSTASGCGPRTTGP